MKDSITELLKETILSQSIKGNKPYLGIALAIFEQFEDEKRYKALGYNYPLRQTLDYIYFRDIPEHITLPKGYDRQPRNYMS